MLSASKELVSKPQKSDAKDSPASEKEHYNLSDVSGLVHNQAVGRDRHDAYVKEEVIVEEKHEIKHLKEFELGQRMIEENKTCCDCDAQNPTWALISHGVLIWYVKLSIFWFIGQQTIYINILYSTDNFTQNFWI